MVKKFGLVALAVVLATGFGAMGEGYIRLTLCASQARMEEAASRIKQVRA